MAALISELVPATELAPIEGDDDVFSRLRSESAVISAAVERGDEIVRIGVVSAACSVVFGEAAGDRRSNEGIAAIASRGASSVVSVGLSEAGGDNKILSVGVVAVARADSAACNRSGNVRPRFAARRKIPAAAFGLKKNRCGAAGSRTADNEHSTAALGHSEISRVKHAPCGAALWSGADARVSPAFLRDFRPEAGEFPEDDGEIFAGASFWGGQKARNVFGAKPIGSEFISDTHEFMEESAPRSSQATTLSRHTEILAGESTSKNVNWREVALAAGGDVSKADGFGESSLEDGLTERLDFDLPDRFESRPLEAKIESSNSREKRSMRHPLPRHIKIPTPFVGEIPTLGVFEPTRGVLAPTINAFDQTVNPSFFELSTINRIQGVLENPSTLHTIYHNSIYMLYLSVDKSPSTLVYTYEHLDSKCRKNPPSVGTVDKILSTLNPMKTNDYY